MKNDNGPVRVVDKVFHVVVGGQKYLTGDDLRYADKDMDTQPADLVYSCREVSNGDVYSAQNAVQNISMFTQADLDGRRVLFKHRGSEYGKMKFGVTDGQFYATGTLEIQASAPFIHVAAGRKLVVQQGRFSALTPQHLQYTTNLFAADADVVYEVMGKPSAGRVLYSSDKVSLQSPGKNHVKYCQKL